MEKQKEKISLKQRKKEEGGITLIALVITIIVLLILAGVTIATLTGDNGILTKANEAKEQTEIAEVKEQAQLDIANWVADKIKNGEDATVNTPEKVQEILESENQNNENKYYKGFTDTGITTPSGYEVPYEELYTTGTSGGETASKTVEDLVVGDKVYYDTENLSIGKEGKIECTVLYDKAYNESKGTNYGIQIISTDVIKDSEGTEVTVELGYKDTTITGSSSFEKAKNSYNNALKRLYEEAQEYLNPTYASKARCVGSDPADSDWDTVTDEAGDFTRNEGDDDYYEYMKDYYGKFKDTDSRHDTDWTQMGTIVGIKQASKNYWLASRYVNSYSGNSDFDVRNVNTSGGLGNCYLCNVDYDGSTGEGGAADGFRPVFTLNSDIKITEGDGVETPYTLVP